MKTNLIRGLVVIATLLLVPTGVTFAHGQPVITVSPSVVAAGGQITVTGTEMEPGEIFVITLENPAGSIPLGEVEATGEGEDGGFVVTFTIPVDTAPGSYRVRAATDVGEATEADLTVTAPSTEASAAEATVQEPTGEKHPLDRSKPVGQIIGVVAVIVLSGTAGLRLALGRNISGV